MSPLLCVAVGLVTGGLTIAMTARSASARLGEFAERAFGAQLPLGAALGLAAALVLRLALPVAGATWLGTIGAGLVQSRARFVLRSPPLDRSRWVPWMAAVGMVALALTSAVAVLRGVAAARDWMAAGSLTLSATRRLAPRLGFWLVAAGLVDYGTRWLRNERSLRMSRLERDRERREEEGDPNIRREQRRRHREIARG
jgi:flagellar biosynthesis protein FlhB